MSSGYTDAGSGRAKPHHRYDSLSEPKGRGCGSPPATNRPNKGSGRGSQFCSARVALSRTATSRFEIDRPATSAGTRLEQRALAREAATSTSAGEHAGRCAARRPLPGAERHRVALSCPRMRSVWSPFGPRRAGHYAPSRRSWRSWRTGLSRAPCVRAASGGGDQPGCLGSIRR
jgi:hypothetical protein